MAVSGTADRRSMGVARRRLHPGNPESKTLPQSTTGTLLGLITQLGLWFSPNGPGCPGGTTLFLPFGIRQPLTVAEAHGSSGPGRRAAGSGRLPPAVARPRSEASEARVTPVTTTTNSRSSKANFDPAACYM